MSQVAAETELLLELTEPAAELLDEHYRKAKPWYPHEFVNWDAAAAYPSRDEWEANPKPLDDLSPGAKSALIVNLLTEDNLPHYFRTIEQFAPSRDHPLGEWSRQWTAEEGRHSIVIRDGLTAAQLVNPWELEEDRMRQVGDGLVPDPASPLDMFTYVSLQELATRVSHKKTGNALRGSEVAREHMLPKIMGRVAADEALHTDFYRGITKAAFERRPSETMQALARQLGSFAMPGTGIRGFARHALNIAAEGIYDLNVHREEVVKPTLDAFDIEHIEGLDEAGETARIEIVAAIEELNRDADRQAELLARWQQKKQNQ